MDDCVTNRWQRKIGWMFWGCISGRYGKGKGLFWEKDWKTITTQTYCDHTVPEVWLYMLNHPGLRFQQDGGPGHTAKHTMEVFRLSNIEFIFWPALLRLRFGRTLT